MSNIKFGAISNHFPQATICSLDWVAGSRHQSMYHGHERGDFGILRQTTLLLSL